MDHLGPQCYTCRKRQVRCDSQRPTCRRCETDLKECLAYKKPLKVVQFAPPHHGHNNETSKSHSSDSLPQTIFIKNIAVILDTVEYYNRFVVPNTPAHAPFKRQSIEPGIPWHALPAIIQHTMVAVLRSYQVGPNDIHAGSHKELCKHRQLSLNEVRNSLALATTDPAGITLCMILMLIGGDMLISPDGSWRSHLEGARKIIALRGGMQTCIETLPANTNLLLTYMMVDIMNTTTSNLGGSAAARKAAMGQLEYLPILPRWDRVLLAHIAPCPPTILQAIIRVNMLRALPKCLELAAYAYGSSPASTVKDLQQGIDGFDAASWAETALTCGHALPPRPEEIYSSADLDALVSLAKCYQQATLLYLLLSCASEDHPGKHAAVIDGIQTLRREAQKLFEVAVEDKDGPICTQLWKMMPWPLIISAYVGAAFLPDGDESAAYGELLRLQTLAAKTASRPIHEVVKLLQRVRKERRASRGVWKWGDGFDYEQPSIP